MQLDRPAARVLASILVTSLVGCGARNGAMFAAREMSGGAPAAMVADPTMAGPEMDGKKPEPGGETWKRSTIVPNASRVMVGDKEQLALRGMQTKVTIDGFRARVVIDYLYA